MRLCSISIANHRVTSRHFTNSSLRLPKREILVWNCSFFELNSCFTFTCSNNSYPPGVGELQADRLFNLPRPSLIKQLYSLHVSRVSVESLWRFKDTNSVANLLLLHLQLAIKKTLIWFTKTMEAISHLKYWYWVKKKYYKNMTFLKKTKTKNLYFAWWCHQSALKRNSKWHVNDNMMRNVQQLITIQIIHNVLSKWLHISVSADISWFGKIGVGYQNIG